MLCQEFQNIKVVVVSKYISFPSSWSLMRWEDHTDNQAPQWRVWALLMLRQLLVFLHSYWYCQTVAPTPSKTYIIQTSLHIYPALPWVYWRCVEGINRLSAGLRKSMSFIVRLIHFSYYIPETHLFSSTRSTWSEGLETEKLLDTCRSVNIIEYTKLCSYQL